MNKTVILSLLKISREIYCIMSAATKMQYVQCDPETFDDEILLFLNEEEAKEKAKELLKEGNPVNIAKIPQKHLLGFYTSLYAIGVNSMRVKMQYEPEMMIQLHELIRRPEENELPQGKKRIENPAFHLTALYFMQILRSAKAKERQDEAKELSEELAAHFAKGTFIIAVHEDNKIPLLRPKGGNEESKDVFQPIFTDMQEFMKFNAGKKFRPLAVEMKKLPELLPKEAKGVVVNAMSVNLIMHVNRKNENNLN